MKPITRYRGDRVKVESSHPPGEKNGARLPPLEVPYAVITRGGGGPITVPLHDLKWEEK